MIKKLLIVIFTLLPCLAIADVTPPWSTSYTGSGCASEWTSYSQSLSCDGISKGLANTCSPQGYYEQITSSANNPNGGGGKGQRHWIGAVPRNNNSGGLYLTLSSASIEFWLRWYMRYQNGFIWGGGGGNKVLYMLDSAGGSDSYLLLGDTTNSWRLTLQSNAGQHLDTSSGGWYDLFPTGTSDGSWHEFEMHLKRDQSGNDGVFQFWVDGVQVANFTNVAFGMGSTLFKKILIGSNSGGNGNGQCMAVDYDDVAISTTGYIGPLNVTAKTPSPPYNLH